MGKEAKYIVRLKLDERHQLQTLVDAAVGAGVAQGRSGGGIAERRTKLDFAAVIHELVDVHLPQAEKIVLVMDNLNTHKAAALYEAFAPAEVRRLMEKLEIHYTTKHGSWLDMAETELSIRTKQCLDRRIPDAVTLASEVKAWEHQHKATQAKINWQFTTTDARLKLKWLYPSFEV